MPHKPPVKRKVYKRRWYLKNRARIRRYRKSYYRKNKKRSRETDLNRLYGITINEFEMFRKAQRNRCRICKKVFDKTPHVDHSHKTGAVRGLLCLTCNRGLGLLGDSEKLLESALRYLKETER